MTRFMLALVSDLIILPLILCFLQNQGRGDCSKPLQNCVMYTNQSFEIMNKSLHKVLKLMLGNPYVTSFLTLFRKHPLVRHPLF